MRIGSLFSGYGGLDMAVQSVLGGTLAWYSEIEPAACQVLAAHHPGVPNLGDITKVDWSAVERVDVLTGGYPCQPFSHAGKRKGKDDERHLWPYVRDAIGALGPRLTVLENVAGHLSLGFADVLADLADLGLSARWGVVRAADVGACHGRKRLFILAHAEGQPGAQGQGHDSGLAGLQGPDRGGHRDAADSGSRSLAGTSADGDGLHIAAERGREPAADPNRDGHGSELHAGGMAGVEGPSAGGARKRQRPRSEPVSGGREPAGHADGDHDASLAARDQSQSQSSGGSGAGGDDGVDWGKYAPAIRRWESVLGRCAPAPTVPGANGRPRLNPVLVEWMMGLPEGHVTGHGLSAAQALKMLGNGVVPQQAALALRMLGVAA